MKNKKNDLGYIGSGDRNHKNGIDMSFFYNILTWVFGIFASAFVGAMLVYFIGIKTSIIGSSMEPTLFNGEEVMINRIIYQFSSPKRGDVIAFYPNGNENAHLYVKRIVGLP